MTKNRYDYEFFIWIDGKKVTRYKLGRKSLDLLKRLLSTRQIEENITKQEFNNIKEELWHYGFELHEITRKKHIKEENK